MCLCILHSRGGDALPPTGPGSHRPDGPEADIALAINFDHSIGADPTIAATTNNKERTSEEICLFALRV